MFSDELLKKQMESEDDLDEEVTELRDTVIKANLYKNLWSLGIITNEEWEDYRNLVRGELGLQDMGTDDF
jgi:hypothetical protein